MKKTLKILAAILLLLAALYALLPGLMKSETAYIGDFTVSPDGSVMRIGVAVASSAGYVRSVRVRQGEDGELRLDFMAAFGGINGSLGAKTTFDIPLDTDSSKISVYRSGGYEAAIEKDPESGQWARIE